MNGWLFFLFSSASFLSAEITRGPYLQLAHSGGITIVWRCDEELASPRVSCWEEGETPSPRSFEEVKVRTMTSSEPLSKIPAGQYQYEVSLTGLAANRSFGYALFDGEQLLSSQQESLTFSTHPEIGDSQTTRIWVVGDSGTGAQHQRDVHEAMRTFTKGEPIDFYLHVGDMAYGQGTDVQFQKRFFEPYQKTLQETVCWASMGNHEGKSSNGKTGIGPYYDAYVCPTKGEAGGVPSGTEAFYSFDYGDIHVICLNSYDLDRKPTGAMAQWLKKDLAATKAKWILGFWHHPPYTKGTHDSDIERELVEMREYIMPILEDGGVDLVLSGHSHIYERSMLIDGAYQTPTTADGVVLDDGDGHPKGDGPYRKSGEVTPHNGTVAVVTGHGGALGRDSKGIIPFMRSIVLDHGSMVLDIEGDTLTSLMLDRWGKERDRFQILKKGTVKHSAIENPKVATAETEERTGVGVLAAAGTKRDAERARKAGQKNIATMIPKNAIEVIPPNAKWEYLAGKEGPETEMWTRLGFDWQEEGWLQGEAGFGYGDSDDRTVLKEMKGNYSAVYLRKVFDLPPGTNRRALGLAINYDDGFSLFVNGREILSKSLWRTGSGKVRVDSHEASGMEYFSLAKFAEVFREGENVIAIEGHNRGINSTDFTLDPYLLMVPQENE